MLFNCNLGVWKKHLFGIKEFLDHNYVQQNYEKLQTKNIEI